MTACLLGGGERLGDERFRVLDLTRADAAWPDAEVILAGHGRMSREVIFVEGIAELPRVRAAQLWFTSRRDNENACENNALTVPQPGRTSRPFILPCVG